MSICIAFTCVCAFSMGSLCSSMVSLPSSLAFCPYFWFLCLRKANNSCTLVHLAATVLFQVQEGMTYMDWTFPLTGLDLSYVWDPEMWLKFTEAVKWHEPELFWNKLWDRISYSEPHGTGRGGGWGVVLLQSKLHSLHRACRAEGCSCCCRVVML